MTTAVDIDLAQFWHDNDIARADPFGSHIPQTAMGISMGYYCMFDEIGAPEDNQRLETDYAWARSCAKAYNDRAEQIVGKRLLNETAFDPSKRLPRVKSVGELFGCPRVWQSESWWLLEAAHTPEELKALLDRVEKLDIEAAMFPDDWDAGCKRVYEEHGFHPVLGKHLRGPVTLATSIYGAENFIYLVMDDPGLVERFRDLMLKVLIEYYTICDRRSDPAKVRPGFSFADDNCALMTPDMYALFAQPILKAMYERFAPGEKDRRYQHSDSDMGHLMPLLNETGMNHVNFGPNVRFADIRQAMPGAVVEGTLAPFTFMRNEIENIEREVRRDLDESRDTRGLIVATAGSINNGTRLSSLRKIMETIWQYGRFTT